MNSAETQIRGKHDELTQKIIGVFYDVYNELGFSFLESVYRESMRVALLQAGFEALTEVAIPVRFRQQLVGVFRADLVIDGVVLLELKSGDALSREHGSQTMNYLKTTNIEVALLMNFGPTPHFKRFVMDNSKKRSVQSVSIGVKPSPSATGAEL
jgi:GxxExxY protein